MASIIGITGAIGSGKTTFSEQLAQLEPSHAIYESRQIISEAGDAFNKALVQEMSFGLTQNDVEVVNQALVWFAEDINEMFGHNISWNQLAITKHRLAVHPAHFVKLFTYIEQVKKNPTLANQSITAQNKPDYRALLQWLGGYLVITVSKTIWFSEIFRRIDQQDHDKKLIVINGLRFPADADMVRSHGGSIVEINRPDLPSTDATDVTEASRDTITPDARIINNGTRVELQQIAHTMLHDMLTKQLKPQYAAQS